MATIHTSTNSHQVAVIGAGASGLVVAHELRREGHSIVVFERGNQVGGMWAYNPEFEVDPLSLDPSRSVIHSSLYASLRTNIPRECMGFREYPFSTRSSESRDPRRYPIHREVLLYLQEFAREFELDRLVRFETEVVNVVQIDCGKWRVRSKSKNNYLNDEIFDAVVVCNGHFTEPRVAYFPGSNSWPGKQIHSHNYRVPEPFKDQVIVVIGSSASAADISRDVAEVAKEVHLASRSVPADTYGIQPGYDNLWRHSMVDRANADGSVVFKNGQVVFADVILHCTGYKYHFPFLDTKGIVTVDDNRVGPLYKHVFPPALAPSLSFVGIPFKISPFPIYEMQSKWVAGVLSGRIKLPSEEEMMEDVKTLYSFLGACGVPKRYTHQLGDFQFEYYDWLAGQCGVPGVEEWRKEMFNICTKDRLSDRPETYRDEWEDDHLIMQAYEDFSKHTLTKSSNAQHLNRPQTVYN